MPYTVTVRDRCMYSHTLKFGDGDGFRTGCTAVVDAVFTGGALTDDGVLIDITVAQCVPRAAPRARDLALRRRRALKDVLEAYDHRDLDAVDDFRGKNTTVEVVARGIFDRYVAAIKAMGSGACAPVSRLEITVKESDVASASYFEEDPAGLL